jgi:hypothetical protein
MFVKILTHMHKCEGYDEVSTRKKDGRKGLDGTFNRCWTLKHIVLDLHNDNPMANPSIAQNRIVGSWALL